MNTRGTIAYVYSVVVDIGVVMCLLMTIRGMKNETNQSVKSERHNFVSIVGDNSRMCRGMLEAFSDCGAGDIHLHIVYVCGVWRSNGRTGYLVE